jgi:hypothetical protein
MEEVAVLRGGEVDLVVIVILPKPDENGVCVGANVKDRLGCLVIPWPFACRSPLTSSLISKEGTRPSQEKRHAMMMMLRYRLHVLRTTASNHAQSGIAVRSTPYIRLCKLCKANIVEQISR